MIKLEIIPVKRILLTTLVIVLGIFSVKGQTKVYLGGQKTGNFIPSGILGTAPASIAPILSYNNFLVGGFYYASATNLNSDSGPFTVLTAARSIGAVGIPVSGADVYIQFRNTSNGINQANTTTYFTLDSKPTLSGIGVPIGSLLGLIELQNIFGVGYLGTLDYSLGVGGSANEGSQAGTSSTKLLIDKNAKWYAAVTPNQTYNSVRLDVKFPTDISVLDVNRTLKVNVYNAFTLTGNSCSTLPQFTNIGEATGVTLNTGALASGLELSQLVANPQYAISGNSSQYSSFSSGLTAVGVANTVSQSFFYDHSTTVNDGIHLKLGLSNSLVGLSLAQLNSIKFYAYSGSSETPVYTKGLGEVAALLGLNLLNLVNIGSSHKEIELSFKPGVSFDRFKIELNSGLLGISALGDLLRIYDASLQPLAPTITVQPSSLAATNVCEGSPASFSVTATVPTDGVITSYQWEYFSGSSWTATGGNTSTLTIASTTLAMNNREFRVKVKGGNATCPQEVVSILVPLTVSQVPAITLGTNAVACKGITNASLSYTGATGTPTSYSLTWTGSGLSNVSDALLTSTPININIPANVVPATYLGNLTVKNAAGCTSPNIPVTVIIHPKPLTPHVAVQ